MNQYNMIHFWNEAGFVFKRNKLTIQVIKNIKNVAGCKDTRTAKSKETRGMIEHNSEVYNHPYRDLLPYYIHVQ